jgi:phosphoribosylanthranilate isomerase
MAVRTKLCGIRSQGDLDVALRAGADAVGFICGVTHASEDALSEDAARDLVRRTPPYVSTVLVTHLGSDLRSVRSPFCSHSDQKDERTLRGRTGKGTLRPRR